MCIYEYNIKDKIYCTAYLADNRLPECTNKEKCKDRKDNENEE